MTEAIETKPIKLTDRADVRDVVRAEIRRGGTYPC